MRQTLAVVLLIIATSTLVLSKTTGRQLNHIRHVSGIASETATKTQEVKVYLVAVGDAGKAGKKIGCDDSLVAVTRTVKANSTPLKAALDELVSMPRENEGQLGNYVFGPNLKVKSVSISKGTATIRFSGEISVAGVCDEPRITEQIMETAKQFPNVKRVKVFVGNQTLANAIR